MTLTALTLVICVVYWVKTNSFSLKFFQTLNEMISRSTQARAFQSPETWCMILSQACDTTEGRACVRLEREGPQFSA